MSEVVNLRLARKARDRRVAEATAATNRAVFGRTKAERRAEDAARERADAALDGARLDTAPPARSP